MFGRKRRERKGIERLLIDELDSAVREYDSRVPSRYWPIFRRRTTFNWLEVRPLAIKGFRHFLTSAARTPVPEVVCYDVATSMVLSTFESYFNKVDSSSEGSNKSDVLSFKLVRNEDIPQRVKEEIGRMRQRIRKAIFTVASNMEANKFASLGEALDAEAGSTSARREAFLNAQFRTNVSCTSIAVSLELFRRTTEKLLEKIRSYRNKDVKMERRYVLLSAVFVYEILDLMISFLKTFEVQGVDELRDMHEQMKSEIEAGDRKNLELAKRIRAILDKGGDRGELNDSIERIQRRKEALAECRKIWEKLMVDISNIENGVSGFRDRIEVLEIKRDEAAENIRIMGITEVTAMLIDNVKAVESVMTMKLPSLPPLTLEDIRRYVPYGGRDVDLPRIEHAAS